MLQGYIMHVQFTQSNALYTLLYCTMMSSCLQGLPFDSPVQLYTSLHSIHTGVHVMETDWIGCSRGQAEQAPPPRLYYVYKCNIPHYHRATAMMSFSLHFCMANWNSITHFVEPASRFFTNWCSDIMSEVKRHLFIQKFYKNCHYGSSMAHFCTRGLVQPILPCRSQILYWSLWMTSRMWRHTQLLYRFMNILHKRSLTTPWAYHA